MRRIVAALIPAAVGMAASAGFASAVAASDDGPELTPPSVVGPVRETPPGDWPNAIETRPMPDSGPVLVVPGVTAPRGRTARPRVESDSPAIVGPSEMRETETAPVRPRPPGGRPPVTLESIPADEAKGGGLTHESVRRPTPPSPRTTAPSFLRRPGGLFSRFLPPAMVDRKTDDDRDMVKVEPRTDPAADAALQRRVERQIRETLGVRLKSYEVRVVGREVKVIARPSRFWQKRGVKSALESLPALSGYRSRIEVID